MKDRLLWKLIGINAAVIVAVILVVWFAIDYLAAGYFMVLMDEYHISPDEANALFLDTVHRYLLWASLAAFGLALGLSFWLNRRVLQPLASMADVTRRLAAGNYEARVGLDGNDEIGRLGQAFDRMADSLARIEGLRRQMVADAAHELRTPLTNIRGYLEALRDGVMAPSREVLELLHGEVLHLVRLTDRLLDLARADAARTGIAPQPIMLKPLLDEALELGRANLASRGLRVQQTVARDAECVCADPGLLRQVLRNLIDNTWQYAAQDGRVWITAIRQPGGVRITFANQGETFPAEDAPFVFERFYRADRARGRQGGNAGIGLAIVKELVEAHGGQVGAGSGNGQTSIWLLLPAADSGTARGDKAPETAVAVECQHPKGGPLQNVHFPPE